MKTLKKSMYLVLLFTAVLFTACNKDDSTTIEGTFSFEGFNADDQTTKSVTQGSFKAIIE